MTEEKSKKDFFGNDRNIKILIGFIVGLTIVLSVTTSGLDDFLPNHITLIVEVAVGVVIAVIVYRLTKKSEQQNHNALDTMQTILDAQTKIINDQNERNLKKRETGEFFITQACQRLSESTIELFNFFQNYLNNKISQEEWETHLDKWITSGRHVTIEHLENHHGIYSDVLNHDTNLWLFECVESLKIHFFHGMPPHLVKVALLASISSITALGKSMTSKELKRYVDNNEELQQISVIGKNEVKSFVGSSKIDEMLNMIGMSKNDIEKFKNNFDKLT